MKLFSREICFRILKFAIAIGLIALLSYKGFFELSAFKTLLQPEYLFVLLAITGLNISINNYRWMLLLQSRSLESSFRSTFPLQLIGLFFNYALPGAIGGDVVKAYYIAQDHPKRKVDAVTSVVIDRIIGLYSMVWMALAAIAVNLELIETNHNLELIAWSTIAVFLLMTCFFIAAFSRRIRAYKIFEENLRKLPGGPSLIKIYDAFHLYKDQMRLLIYAFLLSAASQATAICFMILVGHALGEGDISIATYFFAVPLGFIVSSVPISPAGIGVGQVAFLVLFQMYSGKTSVLGQTAITAFQLAALTWGLGGAYFYLHRKRPQQLDEVSP